MVTEIPIFGYCRVSGMVVLLQPQNKELMGLFSKIFSNARKPEGFFGRMMVDGMHTYTPDELRSHLAAAGFRDITVYSEEQHRWLAVTASR